MIIIAHRGLLDGPNKSVENTPLQIRYAIALGYHAEIDLWFMDDKWYLGHDNPVNEIPFAFIEENKNKLWIHCKNFGALAQLVPFSSYRYFWHEEDDYTLTSDNQIWTYPGRNLGQNSIAVLPEISGETGWKSTLELAKRYEILGVCTDYVTKFVEELQTDK